MNTESLIFAVMLGRCRGIVVSGNSFYLWCGKESQTFIDIPWYDSGARFLTTDGIFTGIDPLCEQDYHVSPYAYCAGDPVNKVDPEGKWLETLWDIANLVVDAESLAQNIKEGNVGAAIVDGVSVAVDAAAVVLPVVPAGAGAAVKAARAAKATDKSTEAIKVYDKASDAGTAASKTYQTYTKAGPNGTVYSGRTSGTKSPANNVAARDRNHHMNKEGFAPAKLDKSSTNADAIRGREQYLIELNGGAQSKGGTSGNRINGVSDNNSKKSIYERERRKEFGE